MPITFGAFLPSKQPVLKAALPTSFRGLVKRFWSSEPLLDQHQCLSLVSLSRFELRVTWFSSLKHKGDYVFSPLYTEQYGRFPSLPKKNDVPFPYVKNIKNISRPFVVRQVPRIPSVAIHGDERIPPKLTHHKQKPTNNKSSDKWSSTETSHQRGGRYGETTSVWTFLAQLWPRRSAKSDKPQRGDSQTLLWTISFEWNPPENKRATTLFV